MLIIRPKNSCLKKCLNIFYKYEHDVLTMGSGGNYNSTTHMEIKDLEDEYVKFLQDLPVSEMANRPQRYTFLNMTISLLEVLIKNEIVTEIKSNLNFYRKSWRMMLIHGKAGDYTLRIINAHYTNFPDFPIHDEIPKFFTYQSFRPISLIADSFSCVENFIEKEFPKSEKFKDTFKYFFDARNGSTHDLGDLDMNLADDIKNNLPSFIEIIKKIISTSLEYRQKIEKKSITAEDQRISEAQKKWLDKVNEAVEKNGGCGKCTECKKHRKTRCKNRVVPSNLWYYKNFIFNTRFKTELKNLRSSLK